jgi:hypothetical protein
MSRTATIRRGRVQQASGKIAHTGWAPAGALSSLRTSCGFGFCPHWPSDGGMACEANYHPSGSASYQPAPSRRLPAPAHFRLGDFLSRFASNTALSEPLA